jgi:hypothetical protein
MAIIYSYPLNDDIKLTDELVGTTEKNINGKLKTVTRNFLLSDLAEFLIVDGGLQKKITLTTVGYSGVSTLNQTTGVLNIPEYSIGTFIFTQAIPTNVWVIPHYLGKFPSVSVVNINNVVMYGDITYIDNNNIEIEFSAGFSGKAYIN